MILSQSIELVGFKGAMLHFLTRKNNPKEFSSVGVYHLPYTLSLPPNESFLKVSINLINTLPLC